MASKSYIFLKIIILLFLSASCSRILPDMTPPFVKDHFPSHGSVNISTDTSITIVFSEKMDRQITEGSVQIFSLANASGKFSWENDSTLIYSFNKKIRSGARYTVTITSEAQDSAGNRMGRDVIFSFQAGSTERCPSITNIFPADLAEGIPVATNLIIWFSRSMDSGSVENNFSISPAIPGKFVWSSENTILRYVPYAGWKLGSRYLVSIGQESYDLYGLTLASSISFSFLTGSSYVIPAILGVYNHGNMALPINLRYWTNHQSGIDKDTSIAIHFSEPMNRQSVEKAFSVSPSKDGWFEWQTAEGETLIFHPNTPFESGSRLSIILDESAVDTDGFALSHSLSLNINLNGLVSQPLQIMHISDDRIGDLSTVKMNDLPVGSSHTNTFAYHFDLTAPNAVDTLSLQDNINIIRFAGSGDTSFAGNIMDISYDTVHSVAFLKLGDLATNNYYQVTVKGGSSGTKDLYDNSMKEDHVIIFKVVR